MINALDQASVAVLQPVYALQRHTATRLKEVVAGAARCEDRKEFTRTLVVEPYPGDEQGSDGQSSFESKKGVRDARSSAPEQARDQADRQTLKRASNGENLDGANDEDIPDYVMRDFDPPRSRTGRLEASSGCGMKSPCDWVYKAVVPTHHAVNER